MNTNKLNIGLLVRASFSKFNPVRRNVNMKNEYAATHNSDVEMHSASTRMVHKRFVDPIQKIETETRQVIDKYTLPWEDRGNRLLPAELVPQLQEALVPLRKQWATAVEEFVVEWDKIVDDARVRLNGDFRPELYPSAEAVNDKFNFNVVFMPMPDNSRLVDSIRGEMEEIFDQRMNEASHDLRRRFIAKLNHLSEKCKALADGEKTRFYESNLTHVLELCDMIPDMLVRDDDELLEAVGEARELLAGIDSGVLRDSATTADDISKRARDLASSLL